MLQERVAEYHGSTSQVGGLLDPIQGQTEVLLQSDLEFDCIAGCFDACEHGFALTGRVVGIPCASSTHSSNMG